MKSYIFEKHRFDLICYTSKLMLLIVVYLLTHYFVSFVNFLISKQNLLDKIVYNFGGLATMLQCYDQQLWH